MTPQPTPRRCISAIAAALRGLEIFLRDIARRSTGMASSRKVVAEYIARLKKSFACWENRLGFIDSFRISRAESGFPVFQNVLELENDRQTAEKRLAGIPDGRANCAPKWPISSCATRRFRPNCRSRMAERLYLEDVQGRCLLARSSCRRRSGVGQPEDHAALLSRPLGDLRRHGQPADDLYGDDRGFLGKRWSSSWSPATASSTRTSISRCRSVACSIRNWPPFRRFHREEFRLFAVAGDDRRPISTRISRRCIPSSSGASCSDRSTRPASPRTIRRSPTCSPRSASRRTPGC